MSRDYRLVGSVEALTQGLQASGPIAVLRVCGRRPSLSALVMIPSISGKIYRGPATSLDHAFLLSIFFLEFFCRWTICFFFASRSASSPGHLSEFVLSFRSYSHRSFHRPGASPLAPIKCCGRFGCRSRAGGGLPKPFTCDSPGHLRCCSSG